MFTQVLFSVRKAANKIIGSAKVYHILAPYLENGEHIVYGVELHNKKMVNNYIVLNLFAL